MDEQITDFDPSEYLDNDEAIQRYIDEAVATGHASFIAGLIRYRRQSERDDQSGKSNRAVSRKSIPVIKR